jgi:hypothetical protein
MAHISGSPQFPGFGAQRHGQVTSRNTADLLSSLVCENGAKLITRLAPSVTIMCNHIEEDSHGFVVFDQDVHQWEVLQD